MTRDRSSGGKKKGDDDDDDKVVVVVSSSRSKSHERRARPTSEGDVIKVRTEVDEVEDVLIKEFSTYSGIHFLATSITSPHTKRVVWPCWSFTSSAIRSATLSG